MRLLILVLQLGWLCGAFGAEESCEGRCDKGFDAQKKCQCDDLCTYYQSCCNDYFTTCKPKVTRGDVFVQPEDEYLDYYDTNATDILPTEANPTPSIAFFYDDLLTVEPQSETVAPTEAAPLPEMETTAGVPEDEAVCSGKPFDAFTSLKNGSIYAFRGKYFYELDEKSVRPGYPRLIKEVWGIEGPIDAAFTRINCQGSTYIFQGSQYWRFSDGVLDPDFPHNISDDFNGIPDGVDAAFSLPAQNYVSSERAYFFKGKKYWSFDFEDQPSRQDCEETSPSLVFGHFAVLQDDSWEQFFQLLFGGVRRSGASRPSYISRDWRGLPGRLNAAMVGRIYVAQSPSLRPSKRRSSRRRHRKKYRSQRRWGHQKSQFWDWLGDTSSDESDLDWLLDGSTHCQPFQSVYFFVDDKYYRVNLSTRRVDWVYPRYPRSIATYWLGCRPKEKLT